MNAITTYIFKHGHYNKIISSYNEIQTRYGEAYKVWLEHMSLEINKDFEFKEYVVSHSDEIKDLDNWIHVTNSFLSTKKEAVVWLFNEHDKRLPTSLRYEEYNFVHDNAAHIRTLNGYLATYKLLWNGYKDSVKRFFPNANQSLTYDEIKKIALGKERIMKINDTLQYVSQCKSAYPNAWSAFSNGRQISDIALEELSQITQQQFEVKEEFIKILSKKRKQVLLVLGDAEYSEYSFCTDAIEKEGYVISYFSTELEIPKGISAECRIDDDTENKQAILGSKMYGNDVKFVSSFSIPQFYKLRNEADGINFSFDDIAKIVKDNNEAIKHYNYERSGKSVVYIENYIPAATNGSSLSEYIKNFNQIRDARLKVQNIASANPLGFNAIYGSVEFNTCDLSFANRIINDEPKIIQKEREERIKQQQREEAERRAKEKETLMSCVSSWETMLGGLKYTYLLNYYPTTCDFEATQDEWDDRWTVWNFKNTLGKTSEMAHGEALEEVIPRLKDKLFSSFGRSNLNKITLVCIPASSQINTERRYEEFSKRLCNDTGMINAFDRITVLHNKSEKHCGGAGIQTDFLSFDENFFSGRYVLLFDDVITRGDSMRTFRHKMETLGAIVIAGMSIGKTKHERPNLDALPF